MTTNLWDALTPHAQAVLSDDNNWSKKLAPNHCAVCSKVFREEEVPFSCWKHGGRWMISFHMKCAFGDKVTEPEEDEYDLLDFPEGP